MKQIHILKRLGFNPVKTLSASALVAVAVALTACGGGSPPPPVGSLPPPQAVVTGVASAQVLEGDGPNPHLLRFVVSTDQAVLGGQAGLTVSFNASSITTSNGENRTAWAIGGTCAAGNGVDFDNKPQSVTFNPGDATELTVTVCPDTDFEPNETLKLNWSSGTSAGTATGTIVNDDAGGLNGTGAVTTLGGQAAFGRDTNTLTNADGNDGRLGFAFDKTSGDAACMSDKVTGLTWARASTTGQTLAQGQALAATASANGLCLKTDWRIPTVNELLSLMDFSLTGLTSINADAFDAMTGTYWSSEKTPNNGWTVAANSGALGYWPVSEAKTVRLVSGGEYFAGSSRATACQDPSRYRGFVNLGSEVTVEDIKTGLMWKQCSEGGASGTCANPTPYTSAEAVAQRVRQVNAASASLGAGHADWRVPTVKELASLVDRCTSNNLAIAEGYFPGTMPSSYVSASYDASASNTVPWFVNFSGGEIAPLPTNQWSSGLYLRLVRAGQ